MAISGVQGTPMQRRMKKQEQEGYGDKGSKIGATVGGVLGAVYGGGPAGAMSGAATGSSLGGQLGSKLNPGKAAEYETVGGGAGPSPIKSSNTMELEKSLQALASQNEQIKQQYGPKLVQAYMASVAKDNA